ncbi:hypothetical protein KJ657_05605 [Patescibacteria group bacterium]|nr:hypothetical protein [Patescibacteria group bacterium]MBU1016532.1 hypothetical protein [Patescibacteria group bacterium]MBU1684918.1 hypothetical protein [Patescibacteria group bacterium]MBU1938336.1 hypothetical protein [Patescibacteria group bacterium]
MKSSPKPPNASPPQSYPPPSSEIPENGLEARKVTVDQFMTELTDEERPILKPYLNLEGDDAPRVLVLKYIYGDVVYQLGYKVNELVESYGSNFDSVRRVLLAHLEKEEADSREHEAVREKLCGFFRPVETSKDDEPQSESPLLSELNQFVEELSEKQKEILMACLNVDEDSKDEIMALSEKYGEEFWTMSRELQMCAKNLKCSEEQMKVILMVRLRGGTIATDHLLPKVVIKEGLDPRTQKTVLTDRRKSGGWLRRLLKKLG